MINIVYHRVSPLSEISSLATANIVSPENFESHISRIKSRIIDFREVVNNPELVKRDFYTITFDDGYKDNYMYAMPILSKFKLPAILFVCANNIEEQEQYWWDKLSFLLLNGKMNYFKLENNNYSLDNNSNLIKTFKEVSKYIANNENNAPDILNNIKEQLNINNSYEPDVLLNWDEIKEMISNNISVGSHGCSHLRLSLVNDEEVLKKEIFNSKNILRDKLDIDTDYFAYPYGRETDYNSKVIKYLMNAGYKYAFTGVHNIFKDWNKLYEIPRIGISNCNIFKFNLKVNKYYSGIYFNARYLLNRDKVNSWE